MHNYTYDELNEWKARAEAAEKQLEDYVEVEEVNRSLVKRGDHYKAKAEAAEKALREIAAMDPKSIRADDLGRAARIARAALEAKP